jgi:hypothetical protein
MKRTIGLQLAAYGLVLMGLSFLGYHLSPARSQPTLITGLVGGAVCLACGLRAAADKGGKAVTILTLAIVNFFMLSQAVLKWGSTSEGLPGHRIAAALVSLCFFLSLAMLMRVAYAGEFTSPQPANPTNGKNANARSGTRPPSEVSAGRRQ